VRFGADSTFRSLSSGLKVPIGVGGPSLQPMMWMFIAILATFLIVVSATPHGAALDVAAALFGIGVSLMLSVICLLKGKVTTGVIGTVISLVAFVGAVRLAKPGSWWATHRYASRPQRAARAAHRYGPRYQQRWNRLRDLVAGAPSQDRPL
jgi:hypothetical protein